MCAANSEIHNLAAPKKGPDQERGNRVDIIKVRKQTYIKHTCNALQTNKYGEENLCNIIFQNIPLPHHVATVPAPKLMPHPRKNLNGKGKIYLRPIGTNASSVKYKVLY